jgi:hypothetical protein
LEVTCECAPRPTYHPFLWRNPRFFSSAIANPGELAGRLIGDTVDYWMEMAPHRLKHFLFTIRRL